MHEEIVSRYRKRGYSETTEYVLSETPRTRVVVTGGMHPEGIRCRLVRQKIGVDGEWKSVNEVNFTTMAPDCGVSLDLDTAATEKLRGLLEYLQEIHDQGVPTRDKRYVVASQDEVVIINDRTKVEAIRQIVSNNYADDLWRFLTEAQPEVANRLAAARIQEERERVIIEFEKSLSRRSSEESYWQKFLENNAWILQSAFSSPVFMLQGETYVGGKRAAGRNGIGGVATDFLFADASTKSFAVVEIKTPNSNLVGGCYRGDTGSGFQNEVYSMHADLSGALIQVRNQIAVAVDDFRNAIDRTFREYDLNCVHARGVLITGTGSALGERQMESFNYFRHSLQGVTIITFDELLTRLRLLYLGGNRGDSTPLLSSSKRTSYRPDSEPW